MDAQTAAANLARLDQLEQTLEAFAENARQMAVITANFQDSSQDALNHKLHTLITGLQVDRVIFALCNRDLCTGVRRTKTSTGRH
jgi:hypothetical protein